MANKKRGGFWHGIFLFLLGVTTGMGSSAAIAIYVNDLHLPFIEKSQPPPDRGKAILNGKDKEEFRFRDLLRQQQAPEPLQPETDDAPPVTRAFVYFLQIGAFRNAAAAEELRGRIALGGREVQIKTAITDDSKELFRVWVGPYEDENTAEANRAQLALEGFSNVSLLKTAQ